MEWFFNNVSFWPLCIEPEVDSFISASSSTSSEAVSTSSQVPFCGREQEQKITFGTLEAQRNADDVCTEVLYCVVQCNLKVNSFSFAKIQLVRAYVQAVSFPIKIEGQKLSAKNIFRYSKVWWDMLWYARICSDKLLYARQNRNKIHITA